MPVRRPEAGLLTHWVVTCALVSGRGIIAVGAGEDTFCKAFSESAVPDPGGRLKQVGGYADLPVGLPCITFVPSVPKGALRVSTYLAECGGCFAVEVLSVLWPFASCNDEH